VLASVSPSPHNITDGDTHYLYVSCMGVEHARSALEGVDTEYALIPPVPL